MPLMFGDPSRNCYETAYTCWNSPLQADASCSLGYCSIDKSSGYLFTACAPLTDARWRACTPAESSAVEAINQHCPPPYKVEGQWF
jgi:hypothetical protein